MRSLTALLLALFFLNCSSPNNTRTQLIDYIPEHSFLVIESPNADQFKSSIKNNEFIQNLSSTEAYKNIGQHFNFVSHLNSDSPLLLCLSGNFTDSIDFTLIAKYKKDLFKLDSLMDFTQEILKYKNITITKNTLQNHVFYNAVSDSIMVASSSQKVVEGIFKNYNADSELKKLYSATNKDQTSLILNNQSSLVKTLFIADSIPLPVFSDYTVLDVDMSQDAIYLNGITKATDSTNRLLNVFENTFPQENTMSQVCPMNSDGFLSLTFNDPKVFLTNLSEYKPIDSTRLNTPLFNNISELGIIYQGKKRAVVLNSLDIIATNDALVGEQNLIDTYRQTDLYSFSKTDLFYKTFNPFVPLLKTDKYCILDTYFVFSDSMDLLQNIIANYQNKTTWSERGDFKNTKRHLSDASSLLQVIKPELLTNILFNNGLKTDSDFDKYSASAIQFSYDKNFAHVNSVIKKHKERGAQQSVTEELNIKLDADILMPPQFVTSHLNDTKEIVVQDVKNNLYLISNSGKILWKKQLNGAVLGDVAQVDMYRNGKLQLAFATKNRLYIIDRLGRDVAPFPGKFEDDITQPLAIFDYENNKKYRLLVTQGRNVLMYTIDLKQVNGFTFKSADGFIVTKPEHFRIGSRDYITIKTRDQLYILNRRGSVRVTPKTALKFSKSPVYLYQNKFTTTTGDGDLVTIDSNGNTAVQKLNLTLNHHISSTSKTLVLLSENNLTIKDKTTALDFGNYSTPKIFYINDKIYVTLTDLQAHKIYMFDSQSKVLPNFPVYGNSTIDLGHMDRDRLLEFTTSGDTNSVILYQIN